MNMKKMLAVVAAASLVAVAAPAFANPFSDVPLNHWAYDAVETLAAKGILEGYPDDTFRGKKAMTRYEIATMVARMMANENVGNEDIDQLKALVVEFGPELEALGVKVDGFDARLAALEKGLSGWKLSGQMRFDYKAYDYEGDGTKLDEGNRRTGFTTDRGRLFLHRDLAQGVSFDARWHNDTFDRFWVTAKDFLGVEGLGVRLGSMPIDWEWDDRIYTAGISSGDAWFLDANVKGAEVIYDNGTFLIGGFAGSDKKGHNGDKGVYYDNASDDVYGARIKYNFGDSFWISANMLSFNDDGSDSAASNFDTYWVALGIKFAKDLELKAAYYMQDYDSDNKYDDEPDAYKIIIDAQQSLLKFTSLWLEYDHFDAGFTLGAGDNHSFESKVYALSDWYDVDDNDTFVTDHDVFYAYLKQQWTDKISTQIEFEYADADDAADMTRWAIALGYQYTPDLYFQVAYSMQDGHCNEAKDASGYEDNIFVFRTLFNF